MAGSPYVFQSQYFAGDSRLEKCANNPAYDIRTPQSGAHVAKIHSALNIIRDAVRNGHSLPAPPAIAQIEIANKNYSASTAKSIKQYKKDRNIINYAYQQDADDIIGVMTIRYLDEELAALEARHRAQIEPARDFLIEIDGDANLSGQDISGQPAAKITAAKFNTIPNYLARHGELTVINFLGGFRATEPSLRILDKFDAARKNMKKIGRIIVIGTSVGGRSAIRVARGISARGFPITFLALNDGAFDEDDELLRNPGAINCPLPLKQSFFQSWSFTIDPGKEFHGTPQGFTPRDLTEATKHIKLQWEKTPSFVRALKSTQVGFVNNAHNAAVFKAHPTIRQIIRRALMP